MEENRKDCVERPNHYAPEEIECIDAIEQVTRGLSGPEGFALGNVLKYVWRWKDKGGVGDLKKARQYLYRLISLQFGKGKWGQEKKMHLYSPSEIMYWRRKICSKTRCSDCSFKCDYTPVSGDHDALIEQYISEFAAAHPELAPKKE